MRAGRYMLSAEQILDMLDTRRRLLSLCYPATVIDTAEGRAKVKIEGFDLETPYLPLMRPSFGDDFKTSIPIAKGSRVIVLFPQGNPQMGVILGSFQPGDQTAASNEASFSFKDGLSVSFKKDGLEIKKESTSIFKITNDGSIEIGAKVTIKKDLDVTGKGNFLTSVSSPSVSTAAISSSAESKSITLPKISGSINVDGAINATEFTAGAVSLTKHTHPDNGKPPTGAS